jgi:hypothetical protein
MKQHLLVLPFVLVSVSVSVSAACGSSSGGTPVADVPVPIPDSVAVPDSRTVPDSAAVPDVPMAVPDARVDASLPPPPDAHTTGLVLDETFGQRGFFFGNHGCEAMVLTPDDHLLVLATDIDGAKTLVAYTNDGTYDVSFGNQGVTDAGSSTGRAALFRLASGKLLVADPGSNMVQLRRFLANGLLDPTFGASGLVTLSGQSSVFGAAERTGGGIDLVSPGPIIGEPVIFTRLTASGALDVSFGQSGVATPSAASIHPRYFATAVSLGDGRFVITGATQDQFADGGTGAVHTGHLLLTTDGVITTRLDFDQTQWNALALGGARVYALRSLYHLGDGEVDTYTTDLLADRSFAVPSAFDGMAYLTGNLAQMAVGSDGAVLTVISDPVAPAINAIHFAPDGTVTSSGDVDTVLNESGVTLCGAALDSSGRSLVAGSVQGSTFIARFLP